MVVLPPIAPAAFLFEALAIGPGLSLMIAPFFPFAPPLGAVALPFALLPLALAP
jgi:hypothetical protein